MCDEIHTKIHTKIHGNAIILGRTGLLIKGASGSGKSGLCYRLLSIWQEQQQFCRWVGDDYVALCALQNHIVVRPAEKIAGMAEKRFVGIETVDYEPSACLDLIVDLVPLEQLERFPKIQESSLLPQGPSLPLIQAPAQQVEWACFIIMAHLKTLDKRA